MGASGTRGRCCDLQSRTSSRVGLRLGGSDFVARRRLRALRCWHSCSGCCLWFAASHGACGCAHGLSLYALLRERLDGSVTSRLLFCSLTHSSSRAFGRACSGCGRGSHRSNAARSRGYARELSFCRHPRGCLFFEAPSCQYHRVPGEDCASPSSSSSGQVLTRPWFVPPVLFSGLDADEQAANKTDCSDDAPSLEAWYDEHDLRNRSWEQVVGSPFAFLFDDHPVCEFDNSEISAVGPSVPLMFSGIRCEAKISSAASQQNTPRRNTVCSACKRECPKTWTCDHCQNDFDTFSAVLQA